MRTIKYYLPIILLFCTALLFGNASVQPIDLTTEYLVNPTGLDIATPRFSWKLTATNTDDFGQSQTAYRILVSSTINKLKKADCWDSGWVSSDETQLIDYDGKRLASDTKYYWQVMVKDENAHISTASDIASFNTGLFHQDEWTAQWIGSSEIFKYSEKGNNVTDPWLRKTFKLKSKPAKANIFVASVGYHELYVNGQKIGNDVLAPAVTDHSKRARYIAYDIADALVKGENVIALWLGTSWSIYAAYITQDKPKTPIVIAQADIYANNHKRLMRLQTDGSWKTHPSPNKLLGNWGFSVAGGYGGEVYDANHAIADWNLLGLNDGTWDNASVYKPNLKISAQMVEQNSLLHTIKPIAIESRADGSYRVDMGVNYAGWYRIQLQSNPQDTIYFMISEREQDDMTFSHRNQYIMDSTGKGVFQNRFNYNSGRWIVIKGLKTAPKLEDITGYVVRTAYANATNFECSNDLQNWIYNTVIWNFENLSLGGYIVDCPQRERFGYGGDAHATSETGLYNFKLGAFYTKWMEDWRDVQGVEPMWGNMHDPNWARKQVGSGRFLGGGILPHTAPTYHGGGGPAWGGIVVSLPWYVYQYQNDKRILEENYELGKAWLEFLDSKVEDNILRRYGGQWDFLGDWLWPNATAEGMNNDTEENLFFNNCFWVYNLKTAAQIAKVLGKYADAAQWETQAMITSELIHAKFYHLEVHNYADKTMRSLAAALFGDIMPEALKPAVMQSLENEIIINKKGHIDVGITGGSMLFKVLRDANRNDLIYSMTSQTTYPSWGFMRESGATTIWEMWEKDLPRHSLLHSSYLYPGAWYIDCVAGIKRRDDSPGFKQIDIIVPQFQADQITWAKASYDSPAGLIKTYWKRENNKTVLHVSVPPNSIATVYFPADKTNAVKVNTPNAKFITYANGYYTYAIKAGNYTFEEE